MKKKKKNNKITNNTLVVLLGISVLISIAGTWITLDVTNRITGAATDTGTTTLTITGVTSCSAVDNTIAFGTMTVDSNNNSINASDWISINNTGNTDINVSAYATENLFTSSGAAPPSHYWQVRCNSTLGGNSCGTTTYTNLTNSLATAIELIDLVSPTDNNDTMYAGVNVTVPSDETFGAKSGTITFVCEAV